MKHKETLWNYLDLDKWYKKKKNEAIMHFYQHIELP